MGWLASLDTVPSAWNAEKPPRRNQPAPQPRTQQVPGAQDAEKPARPRRTLFHPLFDPLPPREAAVGRPSGLRARKSRSIEEETVIAPWIVASSVWEEASVWLKEELPREWIERLARMAENLYLLNSQFRRRARGRGNAGRDYVWAFMRHWLSALLYRRRPGLYARLPDRYALGDPPPAKSTASAASTPPAPR
jgi:hypothetical protein